MGPNGLVIPTHPRQAPSRPDPQPTTPPPTPPASPPGPHPLKRAHHRPNPCHRTLHRPASIPGAATASTNDLLDLLTPGLAEDARRPPPDSSSSAVPEPAEPDTQTIGDHAREEGEPLSDQTRNIVQSVSRRLHEARELLAAAEQTAALQRSMRQHDYALNWEAAQALLDSGPNRPAWSALQGGAEHLLEQLRDSTTSAAGSTTPRPLPGGVSWSTPDRLIGRPRLRQPQ